MFGGLALATAVGAPFAALAWLAFTGHRHLQAATVAAGTGLVAWIAVELAFVRAFSFLQVVFAAVGVAFALAGRDRRRGPGRLLRNQ